jgi:epoxyqueuosine reductase
MLNRHIRQECCPYNVRFAPETSEPDYAARGPGERPSGTGPQAKAPVGHPGTVAPSLIDLLRVALDEAAWDSFSRGSAIRRAGRAGFARNVAVALGSWGAEAAVPVLTEALSDASPLVREHAAWALGRIGPSSSEESLELRAAAETDP